MILYCFDRYQGFHRFIFVTGDPNVVIAWCKETFGEPCRKRWGLTAREVRIVSDTDACLFKLRFM